MRLLVLCPKCQRQYDASDRAIGSTFSCQCGQVVTVQQPKGHDAAVVRCSSCGAPRREGSASCEHCGADFTLHERDLDTVCPHCLARVSDQAQFCHHCGRPLLPESIITESSTFVCPACGEGHTLSSRKMADVNVLECPRCTGVWLGKDTVRLLIQRAIADGLQIRPALPPQALVAAPSDLPRDMPPLPTRLYRPCPFCQGLMIRQCIGLQSGIIVDYCGEHGFWFDEHELERSLAWVRSGGVIEINVQRAVRVGQDRPPSGDADRPLVAAHPEFLDDWGWIWLLVGGLAMMARILMHR